MSHETQRQNLLSQFDPSAVIGTVASLIAFVVMGYLVHSLMWQPVELRENTGPPEVEVPAQSPTRPLKIVSSQHLTA